VLTVSVLGDSSDFTLTVNGVDADGVSFSRTLNLSGNASTETDIVAADVRSIFKDVSGAPVSLALGDTEVAYLESWQTESRVARYVVPDSGNCEEQIVRAILRPRWFRKTRDTDPMQVRNLPALTNMAIAVMAERAGDVQRAQAYEARAIALLETERTSRESGHQKRMEVQRRGFMRSKVRQLR